MSNLYLPIYNKKIKNNNIFNMHYDKESLNKFLENIKLLYNDKYICEDSENNLVEYSVNPLLYTILMDIINYDVVDLRFLGVYMRVNFNERFGNNYTENDKINILCQLKNIEAFSNHIQLANKEKISDLVYGIELQQVANNLTINERNMLKRDFNNIMLQFFDLFDIEMIKAKRNYMDYVMNGKYEIAVINGNILTHDSFQKVYKKFF